MPPRHQHPVRLPGDGDAARDLVDQLRDALPGFRRHLQYRRVRHAADLFHRNRRRQIPLVQAHDAAPVRAFQQLAVGFIQRRGGIQHDQHHVGALHGLLRPVHADLFDGILGVPLPGGIGKLRHHAADAHALGQHVPGGAGNVGHDGPLLVQKRVHQAGLAHVGPPRQHDGRALPQQPRAAAVAPRADFAYDVSQIPGDLRRGGLFLYFIGKISARLQQRQHARQPVGNPLHKPGYAALQLPHGRPRRRFAVGADQLHHRFGLRQVDASVQKRPLRELPGLRHARAQRQRPVQHRRRAHRAAVTVDLGHVLAGVGGRRAHQHRHHLVQRLAVRAGNVAVHQPVGFKTFPRFRGNEHVFQNFFRPIAADAHDGDAARPGRRGNGGDGTGIIRHKKPLFQ